MCVLGPLTACLLPCAPLCRLARLPLLLFSDTVKVPLWVKKGGLKFPADPNTPVIMIGPGTGVAPFRAAIQERVAQGREGDLDREKALLLIRGGFGVN